MALQLLPATTDTAAIAAQIAATHDLAVKAEADAAAADAKAANARSMVLTRDPRLMSLEDVASKFATEIARTDRVHADLQAGIDTALARTMTPGPAGPPGKDGVGTPGRDGVDGRPGADGQSIKGDTGAAGKDGVAGLAGVTGATGTANLAIGARPISALVLGGNTTITLPLSRTMPNTDYRVEFAHSAVVALANVTYTNVVKTTTTVTVKVTAVGLALVAGTLLVVAT